MTFQDVSLTAPDGIPQGREQVQKYFRLSRRNSRQSFGMGTILVPTSKS